ncbi:hypothetical protein BDV59DRAFT_187343 [Aspergillus ambiguus]|uniref:uncharacterized protein n=1 Tax=Aspergillus ambiguus TaxID=176160 RepID=UPI003CCCE22B
MTARSYFPVTPSQVAGLCLALTGHPILKYSTKTMRVEEDSTRITLPAGTVPQAVDAGFQKNQFKAGPHLHPGYRVQTTRLLMQTGPTGQVISNDEWFYPAGPAA